MNLNKYQYFYEFANDVVIREMKNIVSSKRRGAKLGGFDKQLFDAAKLILSYYS